MAGSALLRVVGFAVLAALGVPGSGTAQQASWQVERGEVRVVCPLTVGGSFAATTTVLTGQVAAADAGALTGMLEVDLTTLDTGIGLRNTHLRDNYLEVGRGVGFARATLSGIALGGRDPRTAEGDAAFTATLRLHGVERPVAGEAELTRTAGGVEVVARFPLVLSDHGIPPPRYLGVGVRDQVRVEVRFVAVEVPGS